jgi:ophiobolin F synthase
LITAALLNDLFSFEKEKNDENVQNAVLVVMTERGCSEAEAREVCKKRIRIENTNYVQVVKDSMERTDLSDEVKRYIWIMQYTLSGNCAWSAQCPRYNMDAKWNELQLLRAEYGVAKYPATWPPKDGSDGLPVNPKPGNSNLSNGNVSSGTRANAAKSNGAKSNGNQANGNQANGTKRKRAGISNGDEVRMNGTNGIKKAAHKQQGTDALVLKDVVSLALDWNLPDLSDDVVLQPYRYLDSLPSKGFRDQAIDSLNKWLKVSPKSAKQIKEVVKMLHGSSLMYGCSSSFKFAFTNDT